MRPRGSELKARAYSSEAKGELAITEACAEEIKRLCAENKALGMRVAVKSGGCGGFQYDFSFEKEKEDDDLVFERDGATVLVAPSSLALMKGSTLDYSVELIRSNFVIEDNPLAEAACGCGVSFSVKMD